MIPISRRAAPGPLIAMHTVIDESGKSAQGGRAEVPVPASGADYPLALPVPLAAAATPDVLVRVALLRIGDDKPVLERDVTPAATTENPRALSASIDLPVDQLEPDTYIIRATILQAGVVTGTVQVSIRKAHP